MKYRDFACAAALFLLAGFALGRWTNVSPAPIGGMAIGYGSVAVFFRLHAWWWGRR